MSNNIVDIANTQPFLFNTSVQNVNKVFFKTRVSNEALQ
jgi:hypothetical protein